MDELLSASGEQGDLTVVKAALNAKLSAFPMRKELLDLLPEGCASLSLTRCKNIVDVGAVLGSSLKALRLDQCNVGNDLVEILSKCPGLASLQLPNNGALRVPVVLAMMPPLHSLDILCCEDSSAPQDVGAIVAAFPRLEELALHLGGDCSTLVKKTCSTARPRSLRAIAVSRPAASSTRSS